MIQRFLVIYSPLKIHDNMMKASFFFHFYWIGPLILSLLQVMWISSDNIICLHFSSNSHNLRGIMIMIIRMVIDMIILLLTFAFSILAIFHVRKCAKNSGRKLSSSDRKLAIRTMLLNVTNLMPWLLVSIYLLVKFTSVNVPSDALNWITFTVMPCSALINPIMYTLSTKACLTLLACKPCCHWCRCGL